MRRTFAVLATVFTVLSVGLAPASASAAVPIDPSTSNQAGRTASTQAPNAEWHEPLLLVWEPSNVGRIFLMCIDVVGAQTHSGAGLHLWDCHGGVNQQWRYGEPESTSNTIVSWDGRCMDSHDQGTANRTRAVVSDCDGSPSQQWEDWYTPNGAVTLRQVSSGMCLEVYKSRYRNGTAIEISDCTAFEDQRFVWGDPADA